jgi:hypothetical protein
VVMPFGADAFVTTLALVGLVILIGALLSGAIERSGLPQVLAFLGLGAALGPAGLGVVNIDLDSPALRVVATLSLVLVLFTDAVSLDVQEVRQHGRLAGLVVGPGTLLSAALVGVAAWGILGLSPAAAAIVGAALASTDPVLLRGMLRGSHLPGASRLALRLESGLNDVVLLPIVLVAMAVLGHEAADGSAAWARLGVELGLLGPALGVGIGLVSVAALDLVRRQLGVRRDYESLYSLGVAFTAYAAAEAVHGSGFLAAFAAGRRAVRLLPRVRADDRRNGAAVHVRPVRRLPHLERPGQHGRAAAAVRGGRAARAAGRVPARARPRRARSAGAAAHRVVRAARTQLAAARPAPRLRRHPGQRPAVRDLQRRGDYVDRHPRRHAAAARARRPPPALGRRAQPASAR